MIKAKDLADRCAQKSIRSTIMLELGYKFVQFLAEGPPHRRLILDCVLSNPTHRELVLFAVFAQAHLGGVGCVAEGSLFAKYRERAKGPDLTASGKLKGRFTIPMSNEVLAAVEARRAGHTDLTISVQMEIAQVYSLTSPKTCAGLVLGAPEQAAIEGYAINQRIQQSEWLGFLRVWRWSEVEVFEVVLPLGATATAELREAVDLARRACDLFRSGHYAETFTACRSVLDRVAKDLAARDDPRAGGRLLAERIGGKKGDTVRDLILSLKKLTNVGSHESHPREPIGHADALLVLRSTIGALSYIAALPLSNPSRD